MSFIEEKAREVSRPTLEALCRALARWNVSPDVATLMGLVLTLVVAVLAARGELLWAGLLYLPAAAFDAIDGTLARVSGRGSRFGAFLDSTIDRLEESIVFLGLIVYYARVGGDVEIPLILVAAVASLMVSYTRARAEALGIACTVGFMTRPPRVAVTILGMVFDQVLAALVILAAASLFTAAHRIYHVWRATGGEAGRWAAPRSPFIAPGLDPAKKQEPGESQ